MEPTLRVGPIEQFAWTRNALADGLYDMINAMLWEREPGSFTSRVVDNVRTWGRV